MTASAGATGPDGPRDAADATDPGDPTVDGAAPLPDDERELLDAFERLAPAGSLQWGFDDAMRRLSPSGDQGTWVEPWRGLPDDLWERGRGAKAAERMLGDVVAVLAQELTEYSQRIVDDVRRTVPIEGAVFDAIRYLAARVDRLEAAADPLGMRPADLALPVADATEWSTALTAWLAGADHPVVVGELGAAGVVGAVADSGADVDGVDPLGRLVWALLEEAPGRPGQVRATVGDVTEHLDRLPPACRSAVVLSGCPDRAALAGKVQLVTSAHRVLVPGGTLVLLVHDQEAWDAALEPTVRDLLAGRPFHPDTWALVLGHLGLTDPVVRRAERGSVHAVVARSAR